MCESSTVTPDLLRDTAVCFTQRSEGAKGPLADFTPQHEPNPSHASARRGRILAIANFAFIAFGFPQKAKICYCKFMSSIKAFNFDENTHGVHFVVSRVPLSAGCLDEKEVESAARALKDDIDAVAKRMKARLKHRASEDIF